MQLMKNVLVAFISITLLPSFSASAESISNHEQISRGCYDPIDEIRLCQFVLPASSNQLGGGCVTNPFFDPYEGTPEPGVADYGDIHPGIDCRAPVGSRVISPVSGTVVSDARDRSGTLTIRMDDGSGFYMFGHMSSSAVSIGDHVTAGCYIGKSGANGTRNAHLHIEEHPTRRSMVRYFRSRSEADRSGTVNPANVLRRFRLGKPRTGPAARFLFPCY